MLIGSLRKLLDPLIAFKNKVVANCRPRDESPMHYYTASTLDAIIRAVFTELVKGPFDTHPTKSKKNPAKPNPTSERVGVLLHLTNPRARLSASETRGTAISAFAELLWYFTEKNKTEFISHYIPVYKDYDEGGSIYGGYGARIFNLHEKHDQLKNIIELLRKNSDTRKAVIQLFDGDDITASHLDIPCTCTLQFLIRNRKLNLVTNMRSNDAYWGLPHDVFAFTMIQEMVANTLDVELGEYFHCVGSLHLYFTHKDKVKQYFGEGIQSVKTPMPPMPNGDQRSEVKAILDFESKLRGNKSEPVPNMNPYWEDLALLLKVHAFLKAEDYQGALAIKKEIHSKNVFNPHIDKKIDPHL